MKKRLLALVAACATLALSAVLLAGCSGGGDAQQSANTDNASGDGTFTLAVGFDQGYPPYGYVGDDGEFTGFDLDLAQAVCEKMGWDLKLEAIDWDAKDALIGSGTINCIWNGFTMEGPRGRLHVLRSLHAQRAGGGRARRQRHRVAGRSGRQDGHDAGRLRSARRAGGLPGRPGRHLRRRARRRPSAITTTRSCSLSPAWWTPWRATCPSPHTRWPPTPTSTCSLTRCPPSITLSASRRATPSLPSR